jgi:hypothetical protein
MTLLIRLFQVYSLPEALSYGSISPWPISLGDYIYILDKGVAKGTMVRRGYILS